MNKLIYISIIFLASCTVNNYPDSKPRNDSVLLSKYKKFKIDSIRFDSIKFEFLKFVRISDSLLHERETYINDKFSRDSALVDTLLKLREQIRPIINSSGNLTVHGKPDTVYFDDSNNITIK